MKTLWSIPALTLCISNPPAIQCQLNLKLSFLSTGGGGLVSSQKHTIPITKQHFSSSVKGFAQDEEFLLPPLYVNAADPIKQWA